MSVAAELGFNFAEEPCWDIRMIPEHVTTKGNIVPAGVFRCGKCLPCLRHRKDEWVRRLTEELRAHDNNCFVTLTYDDEHLPLTCDDPRTGEVLYDSDIIPQMWKPHIKKFHADMRKRFQQGFYNLTFVSPWSGQSFSSRVELPKKQYPKFYLTSELGPTGGRPHYHAVYYGTPPLYDFEGLVRQLWPYGFVSVFPAAEGAAGYISKYLVTDKLAEHSLEGQLPPFAMMSNGLGKAYIDRMKEFHLADPENRQYYQYRGQHGRLSRYYRLKIFPEDFREAHKYDGQSELHRIWSMYQDLPQDKREALYKERRKFIHDQEEAERWKILKKQSLK